MSSAVAEGFFIAGTVPLIAAGGLHALYALRDVARPRYFAPIDRAALPLTQQTGIRLVGKDTPSLWSVWLGVHISHGLGVFTFGLICLLIALEDFALVEELAWLRPLAILFSGAYLALSLRFWFRAPALITGTALACFVVAAAFSL